MERAAATRDQRFDGWFVQAITSTGIYCRPSCPARPALREHVRFYGTAAAAQSAGYRACKRCRPDAAPGSPEWDARSDVVGRGMRAIRDGAVDRSGIESLAGSLGVSARQLHRLFVAEIGTGPLAVARAQRAQTARILIETTDLPMADVALGAGFSSVRQFNDTVSQVFAGSPTDLRSRSRRKRTQPRSAGALTLRLAYREPFDAESVFGFLALRAIPGIESCDGKTYVRSLVLPNGDGVVELTDAGGYVACSLRLDSISDLAVAISRCRRLLDLDADCISVAETLASEPRFEPLLRRRPGLRAPGAVDPYEIVIRGVLGQQISIAAARTHAARLVSAVGRPLASPVAGVTHTFPRPEALAEVADAAMALPETRRRTIRAVSQAVAEGTVLLEPGIDRQETRRALLAVRGIGPWTAAYVAMRGLGDPDVLLDGDLGVVTAAERLGLPRSSKELAALGERWSPWRTYATTHLWASLAQPPDLAHAQSEGSTS